jgi:Mrp family chromosome partitioning ATPase
VDGVISVVEAEKTKWEVAEEAKERLKAAGARILGGV